MIYSTLIVDDEPLAIKRIKRLLQIHLNRIKIIGEANDGQQAVEFIDKLKPDLVFLDIQMPELNGFEVLEKITESPSIIFTTAYDNYAIKAFEVNSVDYLLKPIEQERLAKAIGKLENSYSDHIDYKEQISNLIRIYSREWISKIPAKLGDKIKFIDVENIAYLKASDKYVELITLENKSYLINESLNSIENKLNPQQFKRTHRSYIVNIDLIDEIVRGFDGKRKIKLKVLKNAGIPVSKSFKDNLNI